MGQQAKEEMQAGQQINGQPQFFRAQDEARHFPCEIICFAV